MKGVTLRTKFSSRWARAGALAALAVLATACGDSDTKTVTAADYRFENLPKSVKAGTTLTLKNSSTKELHEMVLIKLPDTEKRPVAELVKLPEDQQEALSSGPPAAVLLRAPGGEQINALGDGKLTEKGRYMVICAIPTGADPAAYLKAAQASGDGPPPSVPGGPPHLVQGMYGEITVK